MQKISEISAALNSEVSHYRAVAKKYKWAKRFVDWGATSCSGLSTALSTASLGTALYFVSLPTSVPLGSLEGCAFAAHWFRDAFLRSVQLEEPTEIQAPD